MTEGWTNKARTALGEHVDIAWLGALRVLFGLAMCISMMRSIVYGWVDAFFVNPSFHFKYYGFGWLEPLPRLGMHAVFGGLALLAILIALGVWFRLAAWLFAIGFAYLQLLDVTTYLNHYYLATLLSFLLALSPADRWGSIKAWRNPGYAREHVARMWQFLFRFQVGIVYTFAGLAKAHGDWLLHAQPLRIWLASQTDLPVLGGLFRIDGVPLAMSWAGFLFDTFIIWFLLWRRTRVFAYAAVLVFHAMTRTLFPAIGMFSAIMVMVALVFFPADWPRRLLSALGMGRTAGAAPAQTNVTRPVPRWAGMLVASYCLLQITIPMRYLAYGDNVRWHEQGMRFSWRVMVREKNGSVTFEVLQKSTGRSWLVFPRTYLTRYQELEMSGQPDLVLQLAQHIQADYARRGFGEVEVRADAIASLNGRRRQRLIDPKADLTHIRDGFAKATWILPAPTEPPPHLKPI
ncbi:MAG: HTTM domain-containing protein [Myxococcales bacterium]